MFGPGVQLGNGNMGDRFSDPRNGRVSSRLQRNRYNNNNNNNYNGGASAYGVKSVVKNSEPENRNALEEKCRSVRSSSLSSSSSGRSSLGEKCRSVSSFSASSSSSERSTHGSSSSSERSTPGNLERFLDSTTPLVPAQYLPKTCMKGWQNHREAEFLLYYTLDDLWDYFKERSVYGAGVPLVLNGSDSVVQYYVPSISAIQLYVDSSKSVIGKRHYATESETSDSETSSDSDDSENSNSPVRLVFEYFERTSPFNREPLADKVANLACSCRELRSLRSIDLLPISWMSVAWYPIYRIPTGPTLKDLDACFLTFHPLATPLKDVGNSNFQSENRALYGSFVTNAVRPPKFSLPAFGLASHKFRGKTWTSHGGSERQVSSLLQSANNWLSHLQVEHPDFQFFISRNSSNRR